MHQHANKEARALVKDHLDGHLKDQITVYNEKREADAESQKTKVATAAEELFERFPRRRYKTRKEKVENSTFIRSQAKEKTQREEDEKSQFVAECANRNAYLKKMAMKLGVQE